MQVFQHEMQGEAERIGLTSEDDIIAFVKELRDDAEIAQEKAEEAFSRLTVTKE